MGDALLLEGLCKTGLAFSRTIAASNLRLKVVLQPGFLY